MAGKVHWAMMHKDQQGRPYGQAYAACSYWMKVAYTLMKSRVTCKLCRRLRAFREES